MDKDQLKTRISAVRRQMKSKKIQALIVTNPENVTYTTAFSGHDSWAIIAPHNTYLVTDSRYTQLAKTQCANCKIIERKGPMSQAVAKIILPLKSISTIGIENTTSIAALKQVKKHLKITVKPVANIVESSRQIKDDSEIKAIRNAARIAWQSLDKTLLQLRVGMTENELAGLLDFQIRKLGSQNSFDTIVAFGVNASIPHHQPGSRKLRKNDTILIDFGATYKGYCSDITRCFAVGAPSRFYRKVYDAVASAQAAAVKELRHGVTVAQIDQAAREVLNSHDLPQYGHGTGHGLGLAVHESPTIAPKLKNTLKAGNVITIEPGVYIPHKLGIRYEDDFLITKTGCRRLTAYKKSRFQHPTLPQLKA